LFKINPFSLGEFPIMLVKNLFTKLYLQHRRETVHARCVHTMGCESQIKARCLKWVIIPEPILLA